MGESRALRYAALVMAPPAWLSTITGTKSAHDFAAKDIAVQAEAWLLAHPEMIAEAREKAARLGYC